MGKTNFDLVKARQFIGPSSGELPATSGNYYWVSSVTGKSGYEGTDPDFPLDSIDHARAKCTANHGDIIIAMPGHVESVVAAGGLALSVADVTVYFMGNGDDRATISFGTLVSASMTVSAAGVRLIKPRFEAAIDALTGPISVTGADCTIENAEYHDDTNINTTDALVATSAADRLKIYGWKFYKSNEGGTQKASHLKIGAAGDVELHDIDINGDFSDAPIYNTTAWARVRLENFTLNNTNAGPSLGVKLAAASAGVAKDGNVRVASGVLFVSAVNQMNWRDVYGVNADGEYQSYQIGDVTDYAHDPALGANNADNAFDSTNTVANADGSALERIEYVQSSIGAGLGAAVAAIQTDLGNPSARTNLQTIEAMLGNPDVAGATIYDAIGSAAGLVSFPAAAAAADGVSVAEVVRYIQENQLGTIVNTGGTATIGGALGDVANVSVATRLGNIETETDQIGTVVNTGGTATLAAVLGDFSNVTAVTKFANIQTEVDKIGTLVNAGGTAELGAMLGDFANVSLVTRLGVPVASVSADIAAVKTEVDKLGTLVNTGGTATLGAMLGDFANVSLVTRLGVPVTSVSADIAAVKTEVDKIGTLVNTGGTATLAGILGDFANVTAVTKFSNIQAEVDKFDGSALSVTPTVGSVANKLNISEGLTYRGSCDAGMIASTTSIVVPDLAGLGNDYFNNKYYLEVIKNSNAVGTNPEGFTRQITDYDSASGTFTTAAFPANVEATDVVLIKHDSLAMLDSVTYDSTAIAAATNGSLMEVAKYITGEVNRISAASLATAPVAGSLGRYVASGGTALGTELPDSKSLYDMVREYGEGYKISKAYADLTGYDTDDAFIVTGDVMVKIFGIVGATGITSTSGTTTLQVGTTADPDVCLPATTIDNSDFAAGDVWVDNNPEDDAVAISATPWIAVGNGADIIMTRNVDDITAGTLTLYCFWKPLSAGATVTVA